jgi:hypothetical protein
MSTQNDHTRKSFAEPRSWSANWCGYGLAERRRRPRATPTSRKPFAEPRGWSAKWCSRGLGFRATGSSTERRAG